MQLDDLVKVTFDGEVCIQIQVYLMPNTREHRNDENRKQKPVRYFRTRTTKTAVLVLVLDQKPETLHYIRDPVLARDKESGGLGSLVLFPIVFLLLLKNIK